MHKDDGDDDDDDDDDDDGEGKEEDNGGGGGDGGYHSLLSTYIPMAVLSICHTFSHSILTVAL